jgi:hypothetical protein
MSENNEIVGQLSIDGTEVTESKEFSMETFVGDLTEGMTDGISAYGAWKIMTEGFKALGVDQNRPSQMFYNYTRNGMIAKRTKGVPAKEVRYTVQEIQAFLVKFFTKHSA